MANTEEKIKAFFSDEEKVKAFMNDEEFIGKISGGQSNPETYVEEFKKFGLDISKDEAKIVQKTVDKALNTPAGELDDSFLKNVAGGKVTAGEVAGGVALGAAVGIAATVLTGGGLALAGRIKAAKAKHAYYNGDDEKCDKYLKQANKLNKLGMDMVTLGVTKVLRHYEGEGEDFYERSYYRWSY